jgi:hypothetical protein
MPTTKLRPHALADSLDLWALRREKVLALLDIRAAKKARELARECRDLTKTPADHPAWEFQWMTLQAAAAAFLERHRSVPPPPSGLIPQGGSQPAVWAPSPLAPPARCVSSTLTAQVEEIEEAGVSSQRPTVVTTWLWEDEQIQVA